MNYYDLTTYLAFADELEKIAELEKEALVNPANAYRAWKLTRMAGKSGRALTEAEQTAIAASRLKGGAGQYFRSGMKNTYMPVEGVAQRVGGKTVKTPGTEVTDLSGMIKARKAQDAALAGAPKKPMYGTAGGGSHRMPGQTQGAGMGGSEAATAQLPPPPATVNVEKFSPERMWTPGGGQVRAISAEQLRQATAVGKPQPSIAGMIKKQKPKGTMHATLAPSPARIQSGASSWG